MPASRYNPPNIVVPDTHTLYFIEHLASVRPKYIQAQSVLTDVDPAVTCARVYKALLALQRDDDYRTRLVARDGLGRILASVRGPGERSGEEI